VHTETRTRTRNPVLDFSNPKTRVWKNGPGFGNPTTYLAHDALRLPAASLLANSGLCVNIEIKIWLLLGVNVDTALSLNAVMGTFDNTKLIIPTNYLN